MTHSNIAGAINAAHAGVEAAKREGARYAVECGRLLAQAKETVPHGGWDAWLRLNTTVSPRTAQLYVRIARHVGVFNLKDSSTNPAFFVGKRVKVSAGYVTGSSYVLFNGEIIQARNLRVDVTDKVLAILAQDKGNARNYAVVNKTLSAGHTYNDRVMACFEPMKALGVGLGYIDTAALSKIKFSRGAALFGNVKDQLRQICAATRTSWSIQQGKLQILSNDKPLPGSEIVLNSRTGLVGMPVQTIQGIEGVCLLNGNMVPGCVVRIDQKSIQQAEYDPSVTGAPNNKLLDQFGISRDGRYKVFYVGHVGDSRGEPFFTNFICVKLEALSSSYALSSRGIGMPPT